MILLIAHACAGQREMYRAKSCEKHSFAVVRQNHGERPDPLNACLGRLLGDTRQRRLAITNTLQGADTITAGSGPLNFNFNSAAESQTGNGDTVVNFNARSDTFTFTGMTAPNGFTGPIRFMDTAAFDGTAGSMHSEARVDQTGGNATLQIDVNGDGVMDSHDIEIHLNNYTGTLHDQTSC